MSFAKDIQVSFIGLTPNPVKTGNTFLIQVGITEVDRIWLDWASTIWANVASLKWGA